MDFPGQGFYALAQFLGESGQLRILFHQVQELLGMLQGERLPFLARPGQVFTVLGICLCQHSVPVGLPGLSEKDQRCCIGGLETEGKVQEYERVNVKFCPAQQVNHDPDANDQRLGDEKRWRAKESGERLRFLAKPALAED